MEYIAGSYDVAIIGAGHAGIEAALAAARLGVKTILFSLSMDSVANLPCNPSIGGTAKGHLVREIDSLGGEMGKAADAVLIQGRMLNRGKGPAVHSLRAQVDRTAYHLYMKKALENQKNLTLKQAEIVDIRTENDHVKAVVTALGAVYSCKTAIIATGTFLNGTIYVGDYSARSGPDGLHAPTTLSEKLTEKGVLLRRFKTGTPARVHRDSIDYTKLEIQPGDDQVFPFSFETKQNLENKTNCYIAYTNEDTHRVIMDNLHRSPLYGGQIEGIGPRYCPSIEDKVVRFSHRPRHQIFVEPMGLDTGEMYLQGLSSSLPEDVQIALYRTIKGFEDIEIIRNAYAIEYDCVDPLDLFPTMEFKKIRGLYGAGQFNGTSGYEEAAAQGLLAGVNAAFSSMGRQSVTLERSGSYIGTLIDDLVTKGCQDPYRMMTSRSEYRLLLRQDNADARMTPIGREWGLINDERWEMFHVKQNTILKERARIQNVVFSPSKQLNQYLTDNDTTEITTGARFVDLLRRPRLSYRGLAAFDAASPMIPDDVAEQVEVQVKYDGYIKKQLAQVQQMKKLEDAALDMDIDYMAIEGIRMEAREKLNRQRPASVGQASRISGVTPSDISVLMIYLAQQRGKRE